MKNSNNSIGDLVLRHSQISLCLLDNNGKITFANGQASKFLHLSTKKLIGKHVHDVVHAGKKTNHSKKHCPLVQPLTDNNPVLRAPDIFYDSKREGYWAEYSSYPIYEDNKFIALLVSFVDASVSMRSHQTLLEHQAKFKAVFVEALYPKLILDDTGEILEANLAARSVLGESVENTMLFDHFSSQSQKKIKDFWKLLNKGENLERRIEVTTNDSVRKTKYVFDFSATYEIQPHMHLLTLIDVTEDYYEQEARNQFIAVASHELKTPLAVIKAYSELLERKYRDDEKAHQYVNKIQEKVDVLTRLINAMVDETKLGAGKLEFNNQEIKFDGFIKESIDELQQTHKHHRITVKGRTNAKIEMDPERIFQVLANLISNATKYSEKGKDVTVILESDESAVTVGVQDLGPGISRSEQPKLFNAFYRSPRSTKKKYPGLGLGLFISRQIVRHYGGEMWVSSKWNEGSTFYFTLPR